MPEKRKEAKTCHECGLEAVIECENENKHVPDDENLAPCRFCRRNPQAKDQVADFHSETWTRSADRSPIIEDPDPHEQGLLRILHMTVNVLG